MVTGKPTVFSRLLAVPVTLVTATDLEQGNSLEWMLCLCRRERADVVCRQRSLGTHAELIQTECCKSITYIFPVVMTGCSNVSEPPLM